MVQIGGCTIVEQGFADSGVGGEESLLFLPPSAAGECLEDISSAGHLALEVLGVVLEGEHRVRVTPRIVGSLSPLSVGTLILSTQFLFNFTGEAGKKGRREFWSRDE